MQGKIKSGGNGVWGEVTMPAHPNITNAETGQITRYIQSLVEESTVKKSLPAKGTIVPNPTPGANVFVLTASYTDAGKGEAKPLTGLEKVYLMGSTVPFSDKTKTEGFTPISYGGNGFTCDSLKTSLVCTGKHRFKGGKDRLYSHWRTRAT